MVANQQMIKNDDVFGYMNNMVEQIFKQNPQLKEKYHPQQQQQQQQSASTSTTSKSNKNFNQGQQGIGQHP